MPVKPPVFHPQDRLKEGRRNIIQGHPLQPPALHINPQLLDDLTLAVEKLSIGFFVGIFYRFKGGRFFNFGRANQLNPQPGQEENQGKDGPY